MTDAQFLAWLKDSSAIRCALVEVNVKSGGVEITRYLSNQGYVTKPTDTPANTRYSPYVVGGIKFTEMLSLDGTAGLSFGDIELDNMSGDRDDWLNDVWTNRSIKVFIGDVRWLRTDFRLVFDGMVAGVDTKSRTRINLKVGDKLQRLNSPVTENKLGGTTSNADKLIPLCFGECHNIEPLLVDASVNEYQVHDGPIESIIEVRDNGVPVAFTPTLSTGKFRLAAQPSGGQITASVQGDKPSTYANDVASIVTRLATGFGLAGSRLLTSELDATAFTAFAAANTQPVGLYLKERTNVIDAMNQLAVSVGARVLIARSGLLSILKLTLPQALPGTTVTPTDMVAQSLFVSQMPAVKAAVQVGYCRNWTVESTIAAGVPQDHAALYKQEWLTITRTDTGTQADYKTFVEPVMEQTLLLTNADALAEANRRLNMYNTQRKVIKYTGMPWLMLETLGGSQTVVNSRFGLSAGVTGQIISLATDWLNPHITVEVLI